MYSLSRSSPQYLLWLQEAWPLDQPTQFEKKVWENQTQFTSRKQF
jgi:hypothetical protein